MYETDMELTKQEREWATSLFEDSKLDRRLRNEPTSDENLRKAGLEARLNRDQDIKNIVKCLETAAADKENHGLTYAVLDVDKMSRINTKYGERVGNLILKHVREVTNYVLREKAYYIGKPSSENPLTNGDQLILILNHAYIPEEDLNSLKNIIKASVAARAYSDLQLSFPSMPAEWQGLEDEEVSVSIGYVAVRDARVQSRKEKRGDTTWDSAKLLRDVTVDKCLSEAKKKGPGAVYGLN